MSFSINNSANNTSLFANSNNQKLDTALARFSSGSQLNSAADNAASLSIANKLSVIVSQNAQKIMNANDSIGMIQIAEGAMSGISENMDQIRVLTLKASNATMNDANRQSIQKEIDTLMKSNSQISESATYNGISLLDGSNSSLADSSSILDLSVDVRSADALALIDRAKSSIGEIRSDFGSTQNQLLSEINSSSIAQVNAASAESNLRDVDFAQESINFNAQNLQAQIGSFTQAQSNAVASNITRLFE